MKKLLFHENKNVIYKQLKIARLTKGLSQCELAAKMQTMNANIDQQMISKKENNDRIVTNYKLACFSKILNVTETQLLSDFHSEWIK